MTDLIKRLRDTCKGHPHAKIAWPHSVLHEAADALECMTWNDDMDAAPKGVERHGKKGMAWMMLAYPDGEGGSNVASGMRVGDEFFVCGTFYCGGSFEGKQYELLEHKITPTHWMLSLTPPEGSVA